MKVKLAMVGMLAAVGLAVAPSGHASPYPVYDEMLSTVQYMIDKYQLGHVDVYTAPMTDKYGQSYANGIAFNSMFIADPALLEANFARDTASGWIPSGCDAARTVAIHESAHVMDWVTGGSAHSEFYALYNPVQPPGWLSGYSYNADGTVNVAEALANSVVAVECGSATVYDWQLYNLLTT